ncbi:MAG: NAD(P)H-dependent glycerol-3-phosphate dehydrogenase [Negativibacillus massiliensis]|uniref:NAD(P)H-dependent glycerol-3-phosphate dehydrogenase n=1 Tax=Negativibacillus massiliensis TaxID=1871035 RepID=UPI0039A295BA
MAKVMVLGAGGFGISLALMCHRYGHEVTVWSHREEEVIRLREEREQKKLLPGVKIPQEIVFTATLEPAKHSDLIIMAVPSFAVRQTAHCLKEHIGTNSIIVCVAKGLEADTFLDFSTVISQEIPDHPNVVLSGPSHAEEVSRGEATTVTVASKDRAAAHQVQDWLMNPDFRVYVNDDLVGVELGGALKNIIAVAAGIADGVGLGDNAKAALMTRGITEIARLGVAMGGHQETFAGLSGIGDLVVTCTSMHSRNRRFGILVGQGVPVQQALEQVGMVVEGYSCTKVAHDLAEKMGVEMPITSQTYQVLYEGKSPKDAVRDLMGRPKKKEIEHTWVV